MEPISISCPHCLTTNRVPASRIKDAPKCGHCRKMLFDGKVVQLNVHGFNKVLEKNSLPVLIDFWAPWCGPCVKMEAEFEGAASVLEPGIRLGRLNTEQNESISMRHNIRSIPTLILFDNFREIARHSGYMNTKAIVGWVHKNHQF